MKKIVAIFGCAFVGSGLRYLLTLPGTPHHLTTLLIINLVGCLLLPLITGALPLLVPVSPAVVTGLSVGLVGSFTTFSTFSLDSLHLLQAQAYGPLVLYMGGSLLGGWLAASAGIWLTQHWVKEERA